MDFISRLSLGGDYTGQPFDLQPWQEKIVRQLFGSVKDGLRQITDVFLFLPRGQGKTEFSAAITAYMLFGEGKRKQGQEYYSAAADKEQAGRLYLALAGMIRRDPYLSTIAEVSDYHKRVYVPSLNNLFAALASDGFRRHSLAPSAIIADELHAWRGTAGTELWDALTSGLLKRKEPLTFVTTTAGGNLHGVCYRHYEYARKVRDKEIKNPSYLPILYGADPGDDWTSERVWRKANPALGTFANLSVLRKQFAIAKEITSERIKFLRYNLNVWTEESEGWLKVDRWDECKGEVDLTDCETVGGIDMSTTEDVTAFVLVGKHDDGKYRVKPYFWIPRETALQRERKERLPYSQWEQHGHVEFTDGDAVDYPHVAKRVAEICREHGCGRVAIDRYNSTATAQQLRTSDGIDVFEHGQGTISMSNPSKLWEWLILRREIVHDGNQLMREMVKNVSIKVDEHELIKPIKPKSYHRIDGVVAGIMALSLASEGQSISSIFDDPSFMGLFGNGERQDASIDKT